MGINNENLQITSKHKPAIRKIQNPILNGLYIPLKDTDIPLQTSNKIETQNYIRICWFLILFQKIALIY